MNINPYFSYVISLAGGKDTDETRKKYFDNISSDINDRNFRFFHTVISIIIKRFRTGVIDYDNAMDIISQELSVEDGFFEKYHELIDIMLRESISDNNTIEKSKILIDAVEPFKESPVGNGCYVAVLNMLSNINNIMDNIEYAESLNEYVLTIDAIDDVTSMYISLFEMIMYR